ncbi:MAG: family permease, partial [Rhodoferax sp.]|nr:family permease [Rhodoferax sp.]
YLAAFVVCLSLSVPLAGLARHLPSAGGLYTYISAGIGPKSGFMTGWLYAIMAAIVPAALAAFTGDILEKELTLKLGLHVAWWAYALVILAICVVCAYRGLEISMRVMIFMCIFEMLVGLGLAVTGLIHPGPGGLNFAGFNPVHVSGSSGFFIAVVLSIFAFTGFESAATIGEESRDPQRIIPKAIIGSLVLIGGFYVFCAWGLQIGWGTDNLKALADSEAAPAFVLADRLWNGASFIVLIALVNSGLSVCIACTTSATRTLYGMAKTGALPAVLAQVHLVRRTPHAAVILQTVIALVAVIGGGYALGPNDLFNVLGTAGTFVYIPIFIMMNIAAYRFFKQHHPSEFSVLAHVVLPIFSTVALLTIAYFSLNPLPAYPIVLAPLIAIGYLVVGLVILFGRNLKPANAGWMKKAGQIPQLAQHT